MTTDKQHAAAQAKAAKLLEVAKDLYNKLGDVLEEVDQILGGAAGIGAEMKALELHFDEAWGNRYAGGQERRYVWTYRKDKPQMKRLIKMLGFDEVVARVGRYLANDDPFFIRNRHAFGVFVSSINQHAAPAEQRQAPVDCRHQPPCRTDQEHTARRSRELRGSHSGPTGDVL